MKRILIKSKIQLSIYKSPPLEAAIEQESKRIRHVYKLSSAFIYVAAIAIISALSMLGHDYIVLPAIITPLLGIFMGTFTALNGNEFKKFKSLSADNFPDEYYALSEYSRKCREIEAYLISVSKLGRAPIYLEYLMLKDWFDGTPARERKQYADAVFSDIAAQANASFRDVAGGCESRPTLLR